MTVELISPLNILARRTEPFGVELAENAIGRDLIPVIGDLVRDLPLVYRAVVAGGLMLLVNAVYETPDVALKDGDRVSVVLCISGI